MPRDQPSQLRLDRVAQLRHVFDACLTVGADCGGRPIDSRHDGLFAKQLLRASRQVLEFVVEERIERVVNHSPASRYSALSRTHVIATARSEVGSRNCASTPVLAVALGREVRRVWPGAYYGFFLQS